MVGGRQVRRPVLPGRPRSVPGLLGGYGLDLTAELSVALTVLSHMVDTSPAGMTMDGTLPVTCAGR